MAVNKEIEQAEKFAVVDARLFKVGLSPDAGWLYAYVRSKPTGWVMRSDDIERTMGFRRDRRKNAQRELVERGLIELIEIRDNRGRISRVDWRVHGYERMAEGQNSADSTGDGISGDGKTDDLGSREVPRKEEETNTPDGVKGGFCGSGNQPTEPSPEQAAPAEPDDIPPDQQAPPAGRNGEPYEFDGGIIRLNRSDYEAWRKRFYRLDLDKELSDLDMHYLERRQKGDKNVERGWFHSAPRALQKKQEKAGRWGQL